MSRIEQRGDTFIYYNDWHRDWGCRGPAFISTDWIYTDKDLTLFQNYLDKEGE